MSDIRIRQVEDWIVDSLRRQARSHGKSLEAALRELLHQEAMRSKHQLAQELRQMQDELRQKYGTFSDSTAVIRAERDSRP